MKPLLAKNINAFLKRFNSFRDGEIRSIEVISPTQMKVTLAGQDEGRSFDWISLELEFSGVNDAKLVENSKLSFIDMYEGISIVSHEGSIAFAVGEHNNLSQLKNSTLYTIGSSVKYKEGAF
ncbi:hypothetical protein KKG77_01950 [bacterium]|nr:hypothetical protein [bacterium]